MEAMHIIEDDSMNLNKIPLNYKKYYEEWKEDLKKKGDQLSKMKPLNESLIKKVKNLKKCVDASATPQSHWLGAPPFKFLKSNI